MDEESHFRYPNPSGWVLLYHPIYMSKDIILKKNWLTASNQVSFTFNFRFVEIQIKTNVFKEVSLNNERFYFN